MCVWSGCVTTTNTYVFNLAGGEVHPIYSELSFALHENLSQDDQDGFSVNVQFIRVAELKFSFTCGKPISNIFRVNFGVGSR
jgi:hypothetical protein